MPPFTELEGESNHLW